MTITTETKFTLWTYFKPIARSLVGIATILGGCFAAGWGGSMGLQNIFDSQLARAELRMDQKIIASENRTLSLHNSDMKLAFQKIDGIMVLTDKTLDQNYTILKEWQNSRR